ncbi:MAG TPA: CAP domain-containing protein, partial [Polyangiaceae bacterium]|nr:CAP domain-containing protein [Polyangiaceae bacterium]
MLPRSPLFRQIALRGASIVAVAALGAACTGVIGTLEEEEETASAGGQTSGIPSGSGAQGSSGAPSGSSGSTSQGAGGSSSAGGMGGSSSGEGGSGMGGMTSSSTSGGSGGAGGGGPQVEPVCERWNDDRADLGEGAWSGSVNGCNPGDVSADGRANALKLVNLYRFLAGLPAVTNDPTRDQKAQACALMMDANNQLNHFPPQNWACYSADGSQAAGSSNIASTAGVQAVDLYMADFGNDTTIGHRRWILSGSLGGIGLGTTNSYSCMWVIGGNGQQNPLFTAWPSPGKFPIQAMGVSFVSVDEVGWTIQSSAMDLSGAQVTV